MTGYEITRKWFDFSFDNPDKVKPRHTALYLYSADLCNRLGWKRKFGLPTATTMEATGIGNYNTYKKTFDDLVDWGFIELILKSKNQHSSNVIALCKNAEAKNKALDKAVMNQSRSTVGIDKPQTLKTINNKKISEIEISEVPQEEKELFKYGINLHQVILKNANQKNVPLKKVENVTYHSWINPLKLMLEIDSISLKHLKKIIEYLKNPENEFWCKIILDTKGLRKNSSKILTEINSSSKPSISKVRTDDFLTSKLESYE
ncbi:hypothetical protein [Christiangramia aquimixticola]|uniref:hypothetical protein n=1 Tax=Christiangramia aquimixticola TaxID=1697558 RepID=UPI003AA94D40